MNLLRLIGDVAAFVSAGSGIVFCAAYAVTAPWWKSDEGRHLMTFTALLSIAFSWISYRVIVATATLSPGEALSRAAVYSALAAGMVWRLALLWRRQIGPGLRRRRP
ncbi:putative phage holin [Actinocorallia longicatena]|uniref:Uncharacterized protein n=1 Tax=Actinocorallia longicatena TaxID=111803 RepID=A0ABP6QE39_9ACTN